MFITNFFHKVPTAARPKRRPWHALAAAAALEATASGPEGLTLTEAADRLHRCGPNELPREREHPAWLLLLAQFQSPLMYLMALAAFVSFFIGGLTETVFIAAVMISNALVGFYQEYKANRSFRSLSGFIKLESRVVRGGLERKLPISEIVPGDILVLRPGDRVPADARLFESQALKVNEAMLTGESQPVDKSLTPAPVSADIAARRSMVFMGTTIEDGVGRAVVVETGINTEFGDIIRMLKDTPEEPTPLQATIRSLSRIVGIAITLIVAAIFLEGYLVGKAFVDVFSVALALFVSAIPEGLLPAITIVLTIGMHRIIRHKGLVRRLAATEALGGVTVICTDKTGTLTEGKMRVDEILTAPSSARTRARKVPTNPIAARALLSAALSSDAFIENPEEPDTEKLIIRGRSTDQALVLAAAESGIRKDALEREYAALDTVFFSSERKFSASLRQASDGTVTLFAIGAPERIEGMVESVRTAAGDESAESEAMRDLLARAEALTAEGFRLVACAERRLAHHDADRPALAHLERMTLLGFLVLNDPLRRGVPEAFKKTRRAGIKTVIVTGDHKLTATAVARRIGLAIAPGETLEGHEIESMTDEKLRERTKTVRLYARVSPRHKLRLVQAFQAEGEVVAMFGDGANDVPALKAANIGVVVNSEVDAAREVADIVLLDSGFATIVRAIEEGRIIFKNIRRVFLYLITQDFSQFLIFFIAIAAGLPLPLLAAQLLFVNLVESGLPDLALTTENERRGVMNEPPRDPKEGVVNGRILIWMIAVFAISGGLAMTFFYGLWSLSGDIDKTRTMVMVLMCLESLFLALSLRSFNKSLFRRRLFDNKWLTGAIVLSGVMIMGAFAIEPLRLLLSLTPLGIFDWGLIVSVNLLEIVLIDRAKLWLLGERHARTASAPPRRKGLVPAA